MRRTFLGAALLALLLAAGSQVRADIVGTATVIDGDTVEIRGRRIRLIGVDAPESSQTCTDRGKPWRCGQQAALALDAKIAARTVACTAEGSDRYARTLATCRVGDENLNAWLVREGWALAYRRYSDRYVNEEAEAKSAHRNIWRSDFTMPWDYRAARRAQEHAATAETPRGDCRIKGNINSKGEKIYHLPDGAGYADTHVNPSRGERYFCSEAEANAAGWRAAR